MSDDIVTRLGTPKDSVRELLSGCTCNFIGDGNCRLCRGAEQIERLRAKANRFEDLLRTFDDYFVCEECEKYCATYLLDCPNLLHLLHLAAWELDGFNHE